MGEADLRFRVAIPARYASTRLPGKPLRMLGGRTLLEHVHRRALASGALEVVIATDDPRIRDAAESFGAAVCMTSAEHPSGTDRLAEVADALRLAERGHRGQRARRRTADAAGPDPTGGGGAGGASRSRHRHGLYPGPATGGGVRSERGQGGAGSRGVRAVLQPGADSLASRGVCDRRAGWPSCRAMVPPGSAISGSTPTGWRCCAISRACNRR